MKLSELALAQKPQTKYFTHGYISFSTIEDELFYSISFWKSKSIPKAKDERKLVQSREHYEALLLLTSREVQA